MKWPRRLHVAIGVALYDCFDILGLVIVPCDLEFVRTCDEGNQAVPVEQKLHSGTQRTIISSQNSPAECPSSQQDVPIIFNKPAPEVTGTDKNNRGLPNYRLGF
jgi:hypothetical protein